jgi:hypothetical protein
MPVHKLANGPIVLTIASAEEAEGNFGAQVCFSDGDTSVYVSASTAAQQLGRMKLDLESVVGQTLAFEQIKKDGKTFTNINKANAGAQASAVATRPAGTPYTAPAPTPKMTVEEASALYGECVRGAIASLGVQLDNAGIPLDPQAIQSAAATIFIAVKGR